MCTELKTSSRLLISVLVDWAEWPVCDLLAMSSVSLHCYVQPLYALVVFVVITMSVDDGIFVLTAGSLESV